jgi:hypothetical protein
VRLLQELQLKPVCNGVIMRLSQQHDILVVHGRHNLRHRYLPPCGQACLLVSCSRPNGALLHAEHGSIRRTLAVVHGESLLTGLRLQ